MKWFKETELACRCCGQLPPFARENEKALIENVLDDAREQYGRPVYVNSGYRCEKHNQEVGGVRGSQHLKGEAADVYCDDNAQLARILVQQNRFDQLILYPTFLHVSYKRSVANRHQILKKVGNGYVSVCRKEVLGV